MVPPAPPLDQTYERNPTDGKPGALRPTWDVPVDPKHGLWAFFRFKPGEKGNTGEHITVEPPSPSELMSGAQKSPQNNKNSLSVTSNFIIYRSGMVRSRTPSQKLSGPTYHLVSVPAGAQLAPHHGLQLQEMACTPGGDFIGNEA